MLSKYIMQKNTWGEVREYSKTATEADDHTNSPERHEGSLCVPACNFRNMWYMQPLE